MKRYITPEQLAEVKKIDLFTYLSNYEPNELVRLSRNDYVTRSHSSLHISNGLWTWWTQGIGGRSALDYLIKVENMCFIDAALLINDCITKIPPTIKKMQKKRLFKEQLRLPVAEENPIILYRYLTKERAIDKKIVDYYIEQKMIYESKEDHAIIFLGYDRNKNFPCFASKRATSKDDPQQKKDLPNSDKQFSFSVVDYSSEQLHVFESPIEIMSYQTLQKQQGRDWKKGNLLSLDGATVIGNCIEDSEIPIALYTFLEHNPHIKEIHVHTNNDRAGYDTFLKIQYHLSKKYEVYNKIPKHFNDLNLLLQSKKMFLEQAR